MSVAGIRKGYVDLPEGQIHYRETGEGKPMLFLHQSPSSSWMWEKSMAEFAKLGYRCVALDYPGMGESYVPSTQPGIDAYVNSIIGVADGLGIDKFYAIGHHTGATLVLLVAEQYPDRIIKGAMFGVAHLEPQYAERLANEEPIVYSESGEEVSRPFVRYFTGLKRRNLEGNVATALRNTIDVLRMGDHSNWAHNAVGKVDHAAAAAKTDVPLLIIGGEFDRGLLPGSRELGKLLRVGRYYDMPGVGGDAYDEAPEELARVVDDFFQNG